MKLNHSNVEFVEDGHKYITSEGVELSGVTSVLNRYLFPDKYANVPQHILDKACSKGTLIHEQLEELFLFGKVLGEETSEVQAYKQLATDKHIQPIASEYLVADVECGIASKIDSVLSVTDDIVDLADYKTTCNLDKSYLSWQTSVYKYLFEKQNPKLKVRNLYGIHLRGENAKLVKVDAIPDFAIESLLEAHKANLPSFANPMEL